MRNLKKILLSLGAVAAIAALATGGTFAVFTDSDSIGSNDVSSGDVEIDLSDGPVIDVANMVIGDTESGSITITNNGDNKATYTLTGVATGSGDWADLEDALNITIMDGTTELVNESLADFNDGNGIGVILSPTGSQVYDVEVELTSIDDTSTTTVNEDNTLENLALVQSFDVDAVQRAGTDRTGDETGTAEDLVTGEGDPAVVGP